jgi:hypothetical protein
MVIEWASKNRLSDEVMATRMKEYDLVMNGSKDNIINRLQTSSFAADILLASMWLTRSGFEEYSLIDLGRTSPIDLHDQDYSLAFKKQY